MDLSFPVQRLSYAQHGAAVVLTELCKTCFRWHVGARTGPC